MYQEVDELVFLVERIVFQIQIDERTESFFEQPSDFSGFAPSLVVMVPFLCLLFWFFRFQCFHIKEYAKLPGYFQYFINCKTNHLFCLIIKNVLDKIADLGSVWCLAKP